MNIDPALLAAVIRDPEDKLAWGVLADWLDEHDQPIRAQAIRMELSGEFARDFGLDLCSEFCHAHIDQLCHSPLPWERNFQLKWSHGFPFSCELWRVPEQEVLVWLRHEPILFRLELHEMTLSAALIEQLQQMPSLERLGIWGCQLDFPHEMRGGLPQVVSFYIGEELSDSQKDDIETARLAAFKRWPEADQKARARRWAHMQGRFLTRSDADSIVLNMNANTPTPLRDQAFYYLGQLTDLRYLEVYVDPLPEGFIDSLRRMHQLRTLSLGGVRQMSFEPIASLRELTSLHLSIGDPWREDFSGLERMISLDSLSLHSFLEIESLIDRILPLTQLRVLHLSHCVGLASPIAIAQLANLPNLRDLALDGASWLTPEHFAQLPSLVALETLDLPMTNLNDDSLVWIVQIPRLKSVNICGTNVTQAGVRELARLRPDVSIDTNATSEESP